MWTAGSRSASVMFMQALDGQWGTGTTITALGILVATGSTRGCSALQWTAGFGNSYPGFSECGDLPMAPAFPTCFDKGRGTDVLLAGTGATWTLLQRWWRPCAQGHSAPQTRPSAALNVESPRAGNGLRATPSHHLEQGHLTAAPILSTPPTVPNCSRVGAPRLCLWLFRSPKAGCDLRKAAVLSYPPC